MGLEAPVLDRDHDSDEEGLEQDEPRGVLGCIFVCEAVFLCVLSASSGLDRVLQADRRPQLVVKHPNSMPRTVREPVCNYRKRSCTMQCCTGT